MGRMLFQCHCSPVDEELFLSDPIGKAVFLDHKDPVLAAAREFIYEESGEVSVDEATLKERIMNSSIKMSPQ